MDTRRFVPNDPQNAEDDNLHVCPCGALKKPDADYCASCTADHAEALREMQAEREREEREALLDDARWCEDRGLYEMARCIREGVAKGVTL